MRAALCMIAMAACGGGSIGGGDGSGTGTGTGTGTGSGADAGPLADASTGPSAEVHLIGRFTAGASPRFDWPGTQIRTRVDGGTLAVRLDDSGNNRYLVTIDGVAQPVLKPTAGAHDYTLATNLAAGAHDVAIARRTETFFGATTFLGFTATGGKLVATPGPGRWIEFVGDSITCGYGVLGPDESHCFSNDTEAEDLAWGALTARQLGAAHTAIAFSGKGVIRNVDNSTTDLVPTIFERTLADDPAAWGFTAYTPDVVVVDLGTNDFGQGDPGAAFVTGYTAFAAKIRGHYPNAWILIAQSPMVSGDSRTKMAGYLDQVVKARTSAGDTKIAFMDLAEQDANDKFGCDYHPSKTTQAKMATQAVAKLRAVTGW
jgi:lysophospholipase L1-like esterase